MTQREQALAGKTTPQMVQVAGYENCDAETVRLGLEKGTVALPYNMRHSPKKPCAIGAGMRIKVNSNIGTSRDRCNLDEELKKVEISVAAGADAIMDLSTGGDISKIRERIIAESPVPIGTVPVYQAVELAVERDKSIVNMKPDLLFEVIEEHGRQGVDFITVHSGINLNVVERLRRGGRLNQVTSRGGALLISWMLYNEKENPLYAEFDRLLELAVKYDMTLSLGDGMRPGCIADATDRPQIQELITLGELTEQAWKAGVQVMVEGPGHIPLDQIEANILLQKRICRSAPFYVLGPVVTDIAPGYDHITSAIGGAIAGRAGADFLCYVTPAEHLRLPDAEDVHIGVITARIAAHAADLARGRKDAWEQDYAISECRKNLDWDGQIRHAIDPPLAKKIRGESERAGLGLDEVCTMCGEYCAIKIIRQRFEKKK